jgi:alpha-tubulin suppressor-like RCC1 family protein
MIRLRSPWLLRTTVASAACFFLLLANSAHAAPGVTSFKINNGSPQTANGTVLLSSLCTGNPVEYKAADSPDLSGVPWRPYTPLALLRLTGTGVRAVYFKVRDAALAESALEDDVVFWEPLDGLHAVAWGKDDYGQSALPASLRTQTVYAVAAGQAHSVALRANGTVAAWGKNDHNQSSGNVLATDVVAIAASGDFNLTLRSNGTVVAWGHNTFGQCTVPAAASGRDVVAIAAGNMHSLALRANGSVVGWGANSSGQLNVTAGVSNFTAIAAGGAHSLGIRESGMIYTWGANGYNQCVVPPDLPRAMAVAAGTRHSLALLANGTVVAWGDNQYGQCDVPAGLDNVVAIAAGPYHNLAMRTDGTVFGWGLQGLRLCRHKWLMGRDCE